MKKYLLAVLCVVCCIGMTACGKTEEQNIAVNAQVNTTETEVVATSETKIEETTEVVEETEVETNTDGEYEEVIGDVDIDTSSLSVADMSKMVLNLDIKVNEYGGSFDDIGLNNFEVLFPGGMYITEDWGEEGMQARLDDFDISIGIETIDNFIAPEEDDNILKQNNDYILFFDNGNHKDESIVLINSYILTNISNKKAISISFTINKHNIEASDKFIAEYIPAFEETLISNFN